MEQNKSIVNKITTEFLVRLHREKSASEIATQVGLLLGNSEKPKAEDFIKLYQSQASKGNVEYDSH